MAESETQATERPAPEPVETPSQEIRAWFIARESARALRCERCGGIRGDEDEATMHRRWCSTCDLSWVEGAILAPLVARLGRRGARKALKALVRGEIGPAAK